MISKTFCHHIEDKLGASKFQRIKIFFAHMYLLTSMMISKKYLSLTHNTYFSSFAKEINILIFQEHYNCNLTLVSFCKKYFGIVDSNNQEEKKGIKD